MKPGDTSHAAMVRLTDTEYAELQRLKDHYRISQPRVMRMALSKLARRSRVLGDRGSWIGTNEGPSK
jgi:hypothetical protein